MDQRDADVIVIGGGIMGLTSAYYASRQGAKVVLLERTTVGNTEASSFSYTRSIRNDYKDPMYAGLAYEAQGLWRDLERESATEFFIKCGCLNLASTAVTPALDETYARETYDTLNRLQRKTAMFSAGDMKSTYPQFSVDMGCMDVDAGFLYLPEITRTLLRLLQEQSVDVIEHAGVQSIEQNGEGVTVTTRTGTLTARAVVITAGLWTNEVLALIEGCDGRFPLERDRPIECKYYIPRDGDDELFTPDRLPVFAYLDVGIFGHPMYPPHTPGVKIGNYSPPDVDVKRDVISSVADFVARCMPSLVDAEVRDVTEVDQCSYDMVPDGEFILGGLPNLPGIFVGTGWNGTGYKFAPLVGVMLAQLALGGRCSYDIERFTPGRFFTG